MERAPDGESGCFLLGTGLCGLGHGDLEEWYLVKKEEGAAGSVLGGGSFLRREGVPGTRKKAPVERRRRFSWFQENGLRGEVSG